MLQKLVTGDKKGSDASASGPLTCKRCRLRCHLQIIDAAEDGLPAVSERDNEKIHLYLYISPAAREGTAPGKFISLYLGPHPRQKNPRKTRDFPGILLP